MKLSDELYASEDYTLDQDFSAAINAVYDRQERVSRACMSDDEVAATANRQQRAAIAALKGLDPEIAKIVRSDPDYDNDLSQGYYVVSSKIVDGVDTSRPVTGHESHERSAQSVDPVQCLEAATQSFFARFEGHSDYFVGDLQTWRKDFDPAAYARRLKRIRKAARYQGIEAECLDAAGRVRSPRRAA